MSTLMIIAESKNIVLEDSVSDLFKLKLLRQELSELHKDYLSWSTIESSKRLKLPRIKIGEISTFLTVASKQRNKFFIFDQEYMKFEADCLTI